MFTSFSECLSFIYGNVQNMVYKFSEDAGIRRRRDDIFLSNNPEFSSVTNKRFLHMLFMIMSNYKFYKHKYNHQKYKATGYTEIT